jgi:phosphoenolpyruvate-protein kinase (PTS system EI component)
MGLRRLSVTPRAIPEVKTQIRQLALAELEGVVDGCLSMPTAGDVEESLEAFLAKRAAAG